MTEPTKSKKTTQERGKLRIGDHWNAITIIALSQSNPLKAIAEMVENAIDAKARTITITRGRENNQHFLAIKDDGQGVPRDETGKPDFGMWPRTSAIRLSVGSRPTVQRVYRANSVSGY